MKILRAGNLDIFLDGTQLRYIQANGVEIVRGIYAAVRNENWDTIIPDVRTLSFTEGIDHFRIELEAVYRREHIHFEARFEYIGRSNNEVECIFSGKAFSSFKKNRIGFCVLHPIKECAGKEVLINRAERKVFPDLISPHQPFFDIESMQWSPADGYQAELDFEGDVFETEDQRNWTDASYKTYCTPLGRPFPVLIDEGSVVSQRIVLKVLVDDKLDISKQQTVPVMPQLSTEPPPSCKSLGLGISLDRAELTQQEVSWLKTTHADHLRVDIELFNNEWKQEWKRAVTQARTLGWKLEVVLHFTDNYQSESASFIESADIDPLSYHSILLLKYRKTGWASNEQQYLIDAFRTALPGVSLGIGTDAYFAGFNRADFDLSNIDFVGFSINPQVHAFDDVSLIETIEAQSEVIRSAMAKCGNIPIHVHSVTLRPRFNPDATNADSEGHPQSDERQDSAFCYQWTKDSMNALHTAGAASITYYETVGKRGIIDNKKFPVFAAFIGQD